MTPSADASRGPSDDDATLVLPVIDPIYAYYLVTCDRPPSDPWAAAHQHLAAMTPLDLIDDVRHAVGPGSGIAAVRSDQAPPIPWEVMSCAGQDHREIDRGRGAPWQLILRCPGRPGRGLSHQWAALAVARSLQAVTDGVLVDVVVSRILEPFSRLTRGADALEESRRSALSTWTHVRHSLEEDGTGWLTTDGLSRFGLPELSAHGFPTGNTGGGHRLLMGLAQRLVTQQARALGHLPNPPAFRTVPRHWTVSGHDCAAALPAGVTLRPFPPDQQVCLVETANDRGLGNPLMEVELLGSAAATLDTNLDTSLDTRRDRTR